jgi:hypothetical protein
MNILGRSIAGKGSSRAPPSTKFSDWSVVGGEQHQFTLKKKKPLSLETSHIYIGK